MQPYSYYPTTYGYSPYMQYQQPQAAQPAQNNSIQWVQGEDEVEAYKIRAGQSVLLMDSKNDVFYIKSADGLGMELPLRIFDYKERTAQNAQREPQNAAIDTSLFVTRTEFEERIAAISGAVTAKKTEVE